MGVATIVVKRALCVFRRTVWPPHPGFPSGDVAIKIVEKD